ncbi:hypothetical protein [Thermococcus sp.]|uniref:hypothetical protein n=1 Tax=Thermococcus sp. TaxID=35749 RepID=UPI002632542B|nr:hypothetical protein [Thermococcus sp.]
MEVKGAESGFVAGALAVVLLGAILSVLSAPIGGFTKLGYIVYDIGVVGLAFGLFTEALTGERGDAIKAAMAIAGALLILALRL